MAKDQKQVGSCSGSNKGVNVTVEVTPHHLSLTDKILQNFDTDAKVAPPIRSKKDRDELIKDNITISDVRNIELSDLFNRKISIPF